MLLQLPQGMLWKLWKGIFQVCQALFEICEAFGNIDQEISQRHRWLLLILSIDSDQWTRGNK